VDGSPVSGANGTSYSLPASGSGSKSVIVRVSARDRSATSAPVVVRLRDYHLPTVRLTVSPASISYGDTAALNGTANGSECGGNTSLRYVASEGSLSGTTFDSRSLQFDMGNRSRAQTKVVHFTATATDQKGGTGSASADLTVTLKPAATRLDDLDFPANSSRVNNCGKRLLLEVVTDLLKREPNAKVVLIGHRDAAEKGRNASTLDRMRVLNAAAVLTAGKGICAQTELSRVEGEWVGTDQASEPKPSFCGTSTQVRERPGQAVRAADSHAQFRRVEIWIVPEGADMPAAAAGAKALEVAPVKALGCPK
jgi:outer membrane protein OmpA-like peptidoglycan-associated protein